VLPLGAACLAVAIVAALAVAATRDNDGQQGTGSARRGAGPAGGVAPVPPLEAERRLELRFGGSRDDVRAAVRCPRRIDLGRIVRCELTYADGIPRALLVRLTTGGDLEANVPYPATLRR
jgi:hypothetical protein